MKKNSKGQRIVAYRDRGFQNGNHKLKNTNNNNNNNNTYFDMKTKNAKGGAKVSHANNASAAKHLAQFIQMTKAEEKGKNPRIPALKIVFDSDEHGRILKSHKDYTISKIGNDFALQVHYSMLDLERVFIEKRAPKSIKEVLMRGADIYLTMTDQTQPRNLEYFNKFFHCYKNDMKVLEAFMPICKNMIAQMVRSTKGELREFWKEMAKIFNLQAKVLNCIKEMAKSEISEDVRDIKVIHYDLDEISLMVASDQSAVCLTFDSAA